LYNLVDQEGILLAGKEDSLLAGKVVQPHRPGDEHPGDLETCMLERISSFQHHKRGKKKRNKRTIPGDMYVGKDKFFQHHKRGKMKRNKRTIPGDIYVGKDEEREILPDIHDSSI
jgi:hypothetical protein